VGEGIWKNMLSLNFVQVEVPGYTDYLKKEGKTVISDVLTKNFFLFSPHESVCQDGNQSTCVKYIYFSFLS